MPPAGMGVRVEAIPGQPLPHGLLAGCTTVRDVTDPHELMGVEWMALGCCPVRDTTWCPDESPGQSPGPPMEKEFCPPGHEAAQPVTLYAGAECSALGWSYEEARAHALATLELGEQRGLEEAFQRYVLGPQAIDLTPEGGPVSIAQGVAALEGCLAESYGGRGVLHVPTGVAALLGCCNIAHRDAGGTLSTLAGNCITIGAGYSSANAGPDGEPAEDGSAWLYISGPVVVRRGPIDVIPDRAGASIDRRFNDRRVLAERTYVPATTCTVCAIRVSTCP